MTRSRIDLQDLLFGLFLVAVATGTLVATRKLVLLLPRDLVRSWSKPIEGDIAAVEIHLREIANEINRDVHARMLGCFRINVPSHTGDASVACSEPFVE